MRPVINFTLNQVSLVIDVEMFDSRDTTELIANDRYNRKKHTQKNRNAKERKSNYPWHSLPIFHGRIIS